MPFKSISKTKTLSEKQETEQNYLKKFGLPSKKPLKAYLTDKEKDAYYLLQRLQTIKNLKDKKTSEVKKVYDSEQKKLNDISLKKQKTKERERRLKKAGKGKSKGNFKSGKTNED